MNPVQLFHLSVILVVGVILTLLYYIQKKKNPHKASGIIVSGFLCSVFGIVAACMAGKECNEVALLINTGGFGRAYVVGLGILLSGSLILLIEAAKGFMKRS